MKTNAWSGFWAVKDIAFDRLVRGHFGACVFVGRHEARELAKEARRNGLDVCVIRVRVAEEGK